MSKVPEYTLATGEATEVLTFRQLSITRDRTDLKQARVLVTVAGQVVYDEPRASKQVNAATRMVRDLLRLKNERAKLLALKAKAGQAKSDQSMLNDRLALLDDQFKLTMKRAPLDGVPSEWIVAASPKPRA